MENQIPPSNPPQMQVPPQQPEITPEILQAMKAQAKQMAIQQILSQRGTEQQQPPQAQYQPMPNPQQPQVVYLRRNLTVAEFILIFAISCGIVVGGQTLWSFGSKFLPSIEIKVK